jgi:hypothetical protein
MQNTSAGRRERGHRAGADARGRGCRMAAAEGMGLNPTGANRGPVRKRATLMPSSSADALLFDLGRVVIDIDFNRAFSRWAGHARCDQKLIRDRFRHDIAYKRHERGEIDSQEFFANLRASLGIDISDAQLLDGWNSILVGEMPGAEGGGSVRPGGSPGGRSPFRGVRPRARLRPVARSCAHRAA